jgi:hypothetical protein
MVHVGVGRGSAVAYGELVGQAQLDAIDEGRGEQAERQARHEIASGLVGRRGIEVAGRARIVVGTEQRPGAHAAVALRAQLGRTQQRDAAQVVGVVLGVVSAAGERAHEVQPGAEREATAQSPVDLGARPAALAEAALAGAAEEGEP